MVLKSYSVICIFIFTYNYMKKIILILISILFATNVSANHYTKKINIKDFNPKQHCTKKKSLLIYPMPWYLMMVMMGYAMVMIFIQENQ